MSPSGRGSLAPDLDLARRAAQEAGRVAMEEFRRGPEVYFKGPDQPVTGADLRADAVLRGLLRAERPDYGWLSEETRDSPERLGRERLWVCDPIDGTTSFVEGIPEFAVCVGLVERGRAVLGVVHNPATGELFHAVGGGGAFRDGVPIRVSETRPDAAVRTLVASRWELEQGELAAFGGGWRREPLGSTAYKMMKVADGTADAFVSHGEKFEWDVAAAAVVVAEAGGRVTTLAGQELRYNRPEPGWRGLVATNGVLHAAVLDLLGVGGPREATD